MKLYHGSTVIVDTPRIIKTEIGRGRYVIVDMEDYEKTQAAIKLITELARGKRPGKSRAGFPRRI
jgi:hypothetical protein